MENKRKKMGLTTKIFISLILGAITGTLLHYFVPAGYFKDTVLIGGVFYVCGNGFLRLMHGPERMLPIRKHREERENGIASAVPFSHFSIDAVTFDISKAPMPL